MVSYAGAGYGITFRGLRVSSMLYVPLNGNGAIKYGPGAFLTVGGALPLWHTHRDRSRTAAN